MPTLLISAIPINHARWLLRADFHSANSFQMASQINKIIISIITIGSDKNEVSIVCNRLVGVYICKQPLYLRL